ncbi:hypothetical protein K435DRAFT_879915 [Dendrothele bispora CBS 962.96]|uniref:Uncharacterized protein n=1 Tax=Dendrothele bispora (strain CBS 962.96) TaxID=1314807 RepID=A0A4S8KKF9_DENBC|nr:hypothetical protein K435DRAFT_879915 [Dendrothele bispora CBS 962.96]
MYNDALVLQKRKADGSFEDQSSRYTSTTSTSTHKRPRTTTDETPMSNPVSSEARASHPTSSSLSSVPGTWFTDPAKEYMASACPFSPFRLPLQSSPSATPNLPLSSSTTSYAE